MIDKTTIAVKKTTHTDFVKLMGVMQANDGIQKNPSDTLDELILTYKKVHPLLFDSKD